MRVAVISDIHSNLVALQAVLADAGAVDATWCLGDLVGYGPQPNECIEELRRRPNLLCIAGNHDWAALDKLDTGDFNRDAENAVLWTRQQLSADNSDYLSHLPDRLTEDRFLLVHGSPRHPIWEYVVSLGVAQACLDGLAGTSPYCLIGHSHLPLVFVQAGTPDDTPTVEYPPAGVPFALGDRKTLINPGSVGQPRDGNPDASYLILDTVARAVTYRRVPYDIAATQKLMKAAGGRLSERLINRLQFGV
jgi:diadenosine tetraphosphatase ApaH/serine/threonine PP2A family protein phosphatase